MPDYDSRPETYEHIEKVRGYMLGVALQLISRAHEHDKSKVNSPEREMFDEFTPRLAAMTYGSDEYKAALAEMNETALAHHYQWNRHHPEHFEGGIHDMNLLDVIEMLCDWKAATLRHADGDLGQSIKQNAERFQYGDELELLLTNTARDLGLL